MEIIQRSRAGTPGTVPSAGQLLLTRVHSGLVMASRGPVCLALWRSKPTLELFHIQRAELAAAVAHHPGTQLFLCIVEAKADPPDQALRSASAQMIAQHGRKLAAFACVIEGTGFRSAITRTVLTGIALLVPKPAPNRFFESTREACAWLASLGAPGNLAGLADQIAAARARLA
jgi:hypothetical protein